MKKEEPKKTSPVDTLSDLSDESSNTSGSEESSASGSDSDSD